MNLLRIQNIIYEFFFKIYLNRWIKNDFIPNQYTFFIDSSTIMNWGERDNLYFDKLNHLKGNAHATEDELLELKSFDLYQGYSGEKMNNTLRGIQFYLSNDSLIQNISMIEKTLNTFTLEENVVAIRRVNANLVKGIKKGGIFSELGFLSASINLSHRMDLESEKSYLQNEALLVLKIPSETNAMYIEEVQVECRRRKEFELLVQRGSKILIEKNIRIFSNRIVYGTVFQN